MVSTWLINYRVNYHFDSRLNIVLLFQLMILKKNSYQFMIQPYAVTLIFKINFFLWRQSNVRVLCHSLLGGYDAWTKLILSYFLKNWKMKFWMNFVCFYLHQTSIIFSSLSFLLSSITFSLISFPFIKPNKLLFTLTIIY